jgi:hypothetical protein
MINSTSRYAQVGTSSLTVTRNGLPSQIQFLNRRFIPPNAGQISFVKQTVQQGDRVDNLTAKFLNDPTVFWRIADFNVVFRADELTETPGRVIEIALPLFAGSNR